MIDQDEFISPESHWGKLDNPTANVEEYIAPVVPPEAEPIQQAVETATEAEAPPVATEPTEAAPDAPEDRETRLATELRLEKKRAREEKARAESMAAELAALKAGQPVNPDIDRQVNERAAALNKQHEFQKTTNDILDIGNKEFGEKQFTEMVNTVAETTGGVNNPKFWQMVEAMADVGDAHKLFKQLYDHPDVLDDIAALPPHRMGAALAKAAVKMAPKPRPVSQTPPPVSSVGRTTVTSQGETDPSKMSQDAFMEWRKTGYGRPLRQ